MHGMQTAACLRSSNKMRLHELTTAGRTKGTKAPAEDRMTIAAERTFVIFMVFGVWVVQGRLHLVLSSEPIIVKKPQKDRRRQQQTS